ncbi:hypothetical protein BP6252_03993 [Coleophoma cylindrospora]|uniref:Uncharacterized protein n=1 Tax=Coleophoma cylindrospora TaxID=1849047 RepID=A0A3D8RZ93_9HELO|nr:hypothetical protein BP6252_03993 [Coleophoma cylindrospora]
MKINPLTVLSLAAMGINAMPVSVIPGLVVLPHIVSTATTAVKPAVAACAKGSTLVAGVCQKVSIAISPTPASKSPTTSPSPKLVPVLGSSPQPATGPTTSSPYGSCGSASSATCAGGSSSAKPATSPQPATSPAPASPYGSCGSSSSTNCATSSSSSKL